MREIKFRAWIQKKKEMCYDKVSVGCNRISIPIDSEGLIGEYEFKDIIPMQFTGLLDKNGKEIYEGDIVKHTRVNWNCPGHNKHNTDLIDNSVVDWDIEWYAFRRQRIDLTRNKISGIFSGGGHLPFNDERADENIIEVIGNIYENPELLRRKNEKS